MSHDRKYQLLINSGKNSPLCVDACSAATAPKVPFLLLLLLLRWANLRKDIEGVPTGVAAALGGLEMVRVTTCMCSPNCFNPI